VPFEVLLLYLSALWSTITLFKCFWNFYY